MPTAMRTLTAAQKGRLWSLSDRLFEVISRKMGRVQDSYVMSQAGDGVHMEDEWHRAAEFIVPGMRISVIITAQRLQEDE